MKEAIGIKLFESENWGGWKIMKDGLSTTIRASKVCAGVIVKENNMVKVGDEIKIISMDGEPQYTGRKGFVTRIDDAGQIHGTWGGCALIEDCDSFEVLNDD